MLNLWTITCHACGNNHATIMFVDPPQIYCDCGAAEQIKPDMLKGGLHDDQLSTKPDSNSS